MSFLSDIRQRTLLFDGPPDTLLREKAGLRAGGCTELLNASRPMDVLDAHQAYLDAGAEILVANTAGASALRLSHYHLADRAEELAQSGVALCKEAISGISRRAYAAAGIGPSGESYYTDVQMPTHMYRAFFAQCAAMEAAGADCILIRSMRDFCEARLALLAARAATKLPILVGFTLEETGRTPAGNPPEVLSLCCGKLGASLVGLDGGGLPAQLYPAYTRLAGTLPMFALPCACGERAGSQLSPSTMAEAMAPYLQAGAAAIGVAADHPAANACSSGASPAHIAALRELLDRQPPQPHAPSAPEQAYICSANTRLPLSALEPYELLSLNGMTEERALELIQQMAREEALLHIDFADWDAAAVDRLIYYAIPFTQSTPLAFHLHTAKQANAALLAYPGVAAVYAHSDAYRVLRAAARYGAEVIS